MSSVGLRERQPLIRKAQERLGHPAVRAARVAVTKREVSEPRLMLDREATDSADAGAHEKALEREAASLAAYDAEPFLTARVIRNATDPALLEYLRLVEDTFGSMRMPDGLHWPSALRDVQVALTRPGAWDGVDYVDSGAVVKALGADGLAAVTDAAVIPAIKAMRPAFRVLVHCLVTASPRNSKYVAPLSMAHQALKMRSSKPDLFIDPSSAAAVKDQWPVEDPEPFMTVIEAASHPAVAEALDALWRVLDELMKSGECLRRRGEIEWEEVGRVMDSLIEALREAREAISDRLLVKASGIAARYATAGPGKTLPLLDTVGRIECHRR